MDLFTPGRICVIKKGSDAGKTVVVKEKIDKHFVKIAGDQVKERKINIKHVEPTNFTTKDIPKGKEVKVPVKKEKKEAKKAKK